MRVLVANRGEIAIRLIQGLNELEIESVALHTPTDRLHIEAATDVLEIPSAASFVDSPFIVSKAREACCDGIVPGYGFLSESDEFASLCEREGLIFIGPSSKVLAALGDKSSAKRIASSLGVPILPSVGVQSEADVLAFAERVNYPIMIKAQDGGGGKGIRIVTGQNEIDTMLQEALVESPSRQVFVEKAAAEGFKHIEIQVVGDQYGNIRTVFERECSLQRRFQKLIEIAPSSLPRSRILPIEQAAVKIAQHVQYVGLGTFEFLVDSRSDAFFFLECNPRIQVEHTVSEQISGLDLVHLLYQICLKKLDLRNIDFPEQPRGVSIQCRLNSEDPKTFVPSLGTITSATLPSGSGIRVESVLTGLQKGLTYLSTDEYDSLLAKVILTSTTYAITLQKALHALQNVTVEGVLTNQALLVGLLESSLMRRPETVDVRSLSSVGVVDKLVIDGDDRLKKLLTVRANRSMVKETANGGPTPLLPIAPSNLFKKGDSFSWTLASSGTEGAAKVFKVERILKNNLPIHFSAEISEDGRKRTLHIERATGASAHAKADRTDLSHISLPFSGVLVEMLIEPGDEVHEADTVATFRQGKMELDVRAPFAGRITKVAAMKEGESVGVGALVAVISAAGSDRAKL